MVVSRKTVVRKKVSELLRNPDVIKTLMAIVPAIIIFYLSYASPFIFSLGLFGRVFIPLLATLSTGLSGYQYFYACWNALKNAYTNIRKKIKDSPNKLQLLRDEIAKTFNMSFLVTVSCGTSVLYALILFGAAPLVLYTSPLFFLASLNFSSFLRNNINTLSKEIHIKRDELIAEKAYYDKHAIKKEQHVEISKDQLLPVDCKLVIINDGTAAQIDDRTVKTGEFDSASDFAVGSKLSAGTRYVGEGLITVQATTNYDESLHYKRIQTVLAESSERTKSQFTQKIDKIMSYFIPVVLVIAFAALLVWSMISGIHMGLYVMMDVFFAACPCTLGLAANCTYAILKLKLFKNHIIVYKDEAIEKLSEFNTVVFDKTGTLTTLSFKEITRYNGYKDSADFDKKIMRAIAAIQKFRQEQRPTDSFAKALLDCEQFKLQENIHIDKIQENSPNGIWATVEETQVFIGNAGYLQQHNIALQDQDDAILGVGQGTKVYVGVKFTQAAVTKEQGKLYASISFEQVLREDARETIRHLQRNRHEIHMITGDTQDAAYAISDQLGITRRNVRAEYSAQDKERYIKQLSLDNKRHIAFFGDGWNDHEASTVKNVASIAMGKSSNMHGFFNVTVEKLSDSIKLKSACKTTINYQAKLFWFAVITNFISMILAAVIFPIYGMVSMMGCLGVCMAGLSLVATFAASFLVPSINKTLTEEITPQRVAGAVPPSVQVVAADSHFEPKPAVSYSAEYGGSGTIAAPAPIIRGRHRHHQDFSQHARRVPAHGVLRGRPQHYVARDQDQEEGQFEQHAVRGRPVYCGGSR